VQLIAGELLPSNQHDVGVGVDPTELLDGGVVERLGEIQTFDFATGHGGEWTYFHDASLIVNTACDE
jgi:hypothetical protein